MKNVKIFTFVLLSAIGFVACHKGDKVPSATLAATKSTLIKKGEPVVFSLPQSAGSNAKWSVSPSANTQIKASGSEASIMFGAKGTYVVTAVSNNVSASKSVSVSDTTFKGEASKPATTSPFLAGEVIKITAARIDSGATSGIIFSAETSKSYTCQSNYLLATYASGANSFSIDFTGVSVPGDCTTGSATAGGFSYLYPISAGTSTLSIKFNGNTYTGTIVKVAEKYTINWANTTGIVISPTSL